MKDPFGRQVDYLRVSITDRCNERCVYCMPQDFHDWLPREAILSYEEILEVARVGVKHLGLRKFRITGGEPLVRRDVVGFVRALGEIGGIESIGMTTNATRLAPVAGQLYEAGLRALNISLDALDADLYHEITRGRLDEALEGIEAAQDAGFENIKLNMVMLKGVNEEQVWPMLDYARERGLLLRMIELMPVSDGSAGEVAGIMTMPEMMRKMGEVDKLEPLPGVKKGHGPARYFRLKGRGQEVGFISAMSDEHFCESCNKLRLTADGFVRPCLGNHGEVDIKPALREVGTEAGVLEALKRAMDEKPEAHTFLEQYIPLRIMTAIGG